MIKTSSRIIPRLVRKATVIAVPHRVYGSKNSLTSFPAKPQAMLFTPGPLATSTRVKWATLRDVGSREKEFEAVISYIRNELLRIAEVDANHYTTVPVQGSGTFALEAALTTTLPREGSKILVVTNGNYGDRLAMLSSALGAEVTTVQFDYGDSVDIERVANALTNEFTHVAMVHCETSSGVINPVGEIGKLVKKNNPNTLFYVDAISSFGAMNVPMQDVDVMVSSANKCLQGTPGFAFVILKKNLLQNCEGNARSVVLDLVRQAKALDDKGQFWCTPPTHSMLAFSEALNEFEEEGSIEARSERYRMNCHVLLDGMKRMGFKTLLNIEDHPQSYIITSFHYPQNSQFDFDEFYNRIRDKGIVIYPGHVATAKCFRIGTIGDLWPRDVDKLLIAIQQTMKEMNIKLSLN